MAQMGFRGLLDRFAGAGGWYFYPFALVNCFFITGWRLLPRFSR